LIWNIIFVSKCIIVELTNKAYDKIMDASKEIFLKKAKDYGTSWRILRTSSLTDQLFIKAMRLRSIEEKKVNKVGESIDMEYYALINYSIMALIQLDMDHVESEKEIPMDQLEILYDKHYKATFQLMKDKNHDYGEAWRDMRVSSMTDLILMKLLRIKQIEENDGQTLISEGVDANYQDIINYAIFAMILLTETK